MITRLLNTTTTTLVALLTFMAIASARAGTISIVDLPATGTDAASGISPANTYLAAFDFGNNSAVGSSLTINGVQFTHFILAAQTTYITTNTTDLYTGGGRLTLSVGGYNPSATPVFNMSSSLTQGGLASQADGSMFTLFTDMFYAGRIGTTNSWITQDYGGLTAGDEYSLRIYYRYWGNTVGGRLLDVAFNGEGRVENYSLAEDAGGAHFLEYAFTASSTAVSCVATNLTAGQSFILYGATLQVVPEPSVLALVGMGCVSATLLIKRRRQQ